MSNIIVAGGAGFIGSHLGKRLINEGNKVFCIDNLITGSKKNLVALQDNDKFELIELDLSKPNEGLANRLPYIDAIFHLASPASPNNNAERSYMNFPIETLLVNSLGTYTLLQLAKEKNAKFLFASTSEVYGNPSVTPQPESYNGNVSPNGIRSVYDEGKRFGEAMTFGFLRKFDVDTRVIRIFNTYGPFMQIDDGRVVTNFIGQALAFKPLTVYGDGTQTRSFCYIDDMVDGIMRAMFEKDTKGEVFNLGNPDERSIRDIAELIQNLMNSKVGIVEEPLPQDDPLQRKPDISKAKTMLHWEPKVSLEDGLKRTIDYFRNQ